MRCIVFLFFVLPVVLLPIDASRTHCAAAWDASFTDVSCRARWSSKRQLSGRRDASGAGLQSPGLWRPGCQSTIAGPPVHATLVFDAPVDAPPVSERVGQLAANRLDTNLSWMPVSGLPVAGIQVVLTPVSPWDASCRIASCRATSSRDASRSDTSQSLG